MNEKREPRKSLEELELESEEAEEAVDSFEEEIGDVDEFNPTNALEYCTRHLELTARSFETEVARLSAARDTSLTYVETLEELQYARWRLEETKSGNYSPARAYYRREGEIMFNIAKVDGKPALFVRGTAFIKMANALPAPKEAV